ncbi:EAL domain-containing protein [Oceanicella sp. SM1341]|uniref:bifunctional diguanylate cyclase/phosphodiesterase n=1 Tax=Oceanicella sp. SM1341 TaxID=1548889 RepID=UPI0018E523F9|nr:EAL domain-containing protein [Oceanicella sp. SM1341]
MAFGAVMLDRQRVGIAIERQRVEAVEELSRLRLRLEGAIEGDVQLLRGLVVALEDEPGMSQEDFSARARRLLSHSGSVRAVALAPGLTVSMVYPLEGNESLIGVDLAALPGQAESARAAMAAGDVVLSGPVDLYQGGKGLLMRYALRRSGPEGMPRPWGIVSASVDLAALLEKAGISGSPHDLSLAITAGEAGADGPPFFGDPEVLRDAPVALPAGTLGWALHAAPEGGWRVPAGELWRFRALLAATGLLILAPTAWAGLLLRQRQSSISALLRREADLLATSRRLKLAIETAGLQIWQRDALSGERVEDPVFDTIGEDAPGLPRREWLSRVLPEDQSRLRESFREAVRNGTTFSAEYRVQEADGSLRHLRSFGRTYADPGERPVMIGANWEVTPFIRLNEHLREATREAESRAGLLEAARDRLEYLANHDTTTGLPNRNSLETLFGTVDADAQDTAPLSVIIVDLHRFKDINDTLGYQGGNDILRHTGGVLTRTAGPDDVVARVGGDEFVIVSREAVSAEDPDNLARRLLRALVRPVILGTHEYRVGVTIGAATRSTGAEQSTSVFLNADIALHEAKKHGRNHIEYFTDTLRAEAMDTKRMADDILRGLERREFLPVYQLQFDARSLEVTGVEALVRWQHPRQGLLTPQHFLDVAEMLNVMSELDDLVLRRALEDFRAWSAAGIRIPRLSVNVSAQRLGDEGLAGRLAALEFQPGTLAFELVETISFDEASPLIAENIRRIRASGIEIEIDDFGTGYASILSLINLSPRFLKIDRHLVMPVDGSARARKLVSSVVEIGRALGIGVIAEGVESLRHAEVLRDLGCQVLQGYALARPMPAGEIPSYVAARSWMRDAS